MDTREIDRLVSEKVMGLSVLPIYDDVPPRPITGYEIHTAPGQYARLPHYSIDIAAAWEVVEKMKADGWAVNIYSGNGSQCWEAEFGHPSDRSQDAGSETSPLPLAICLAALRVKGVEVDNA